MKKLLGFILLLSLAPHFPLSAKGEDRGAVTLEQHFHIGNRHYIIEIYKSQYDNMEKWNLYSGTPPPIPPKVACEKAEQSIKKIAPIKGCIWEVESVSLEPFFSPKDGAWRWHVHFRQKFPNSGYTGKPLEKIYIIVTMDGEVIEPRLVEEKK